MVREPLPPKSKVVHQGVSVPVVENGHAVDPPFPIDPKARRIGNAEQEIIRQTLTNLAIFPFTKRLGLSIEEVLTLVAGACIDAANLDLKAYFPL